MGEAKRRHDHLKLIQKENQMSDGNGENILVVGQKPQPPALGKIVFEMRIDETGMVDVKAEKCNVKFVCKQLLLVCDKLIDEIKESRIIEP